jgi:tetratricopeptide (TPR) repeat protein
MKTSRMGIFSLGAVALVVALGCGPRKQVTERDRKEAAHLISEAQFALSVREWSRAESLLAKAVHLAPSGDTWVSLGGARLRLNNRAGAKDAYQSALKAYEAEAVRRNLVAEPWIKQAYVLALLRREADSRAVLAKAAKHFPNDPKLRAFSDPKEFEKLLASQKFKDMAL